MSVDEFFAAAEKLKAAGVTPLCVGDSGIWATAQLFENTLLGVIGPEKYMGLWDGSVSLRRPGGQEGHGDLRQDAGLPEHRSLARCRGTRRSRS